MALIDFKEVYVKQFLKVWEAWKITDDPRDPGRYTAFGISRRYHPDAEIFKLIDSGVRNVDVLQNSAASFYHQWYLKTDTINYLPAILEIPFFDFVVNAGEDDAILCWQKTVNFFKNGFLLEDGILGPTTRRISKDVASGFNTQTHLLIFQNYRLSIYIDKVSNNPEKAVFIKGWKNRVNALTRLMWREIP